MDPSWEKAVKHGDVADVRAQLERGTAVDARDRYGQTGLMLAAHAGHREVVEVLLEHGAGLDVTAKYGLSALMRAIVAGHPDVALLPARAGADLSLRESGAPGFADQTARNLAVARGMHGLAAELEPGSWWLAVATDLTGA